MTCNLSKFLTDNLITTALNIFIRSLFKLSDIQLADKIAGRNRPSIPCGNSRNLCMNDKFFIGQPEDILIKYKPEISFSAKIKSDYKTVTAFKRIFIVYLNSCDNQIDTLFMKCCKTYPF